MSDEQKKLVPIKYTSRDYKSIRKDLMEMAERLYPDTFQDFSEASFGSMMIDAVAYVGDQLSFYLDYNVNETFLDTSYQTENILRHGRIMGYKHPGRSSTYGTAAIFVLIPASTTGIGPDAAYLPVLKRGSRFTSATGLNFVLTENVDFASPKNTTVVAQVDESTGAPTYYAIKAYGNVVSGFFSQETVTVGDYERFKKIKLSAKNVSEIVSVFDSDGNEYFEVDYLAQDTVFKEIANNNYKNDNVPSILKPFLVSRKFVIERDRNFTYLQFGSGDNSQDNVIAEPQNVAMNIFGKNYVTDTTFDPSRISSNKTFGVSPSNTTLTVVYRVTNPINSNLTAGGLNKVSRANLDFKNRNSLITSTVDTIRNSVEVTNETPIVGDVSNASSTEIKRRIYDTFPTQNRAVTQADYENVALRMPAKFGSVKRVSAQRDPTSANRNLNIYVVSEDAQGKLTNTNGTIKNNLKTWLNQYRMVNDTIDIVDPYIVNIGIDFAIRAMPGVDKFALLDSAISSLTKTYETSLYIGEHFSISEIYEELKKVRGVQDVYKVTLSSKTSESYSGATFDINANLSPDGSYLIVPKNAIIEIKFPSTDIKGKIR